MSDSSKVSGGADFTREHSQKLRDIAKLSGKNIPKQKLQKGTQQGPRVVIVACGSFSPITYMHLRMFEMAKDFGKQNGLNIIGGYLSPVTDAYKKQGLAPASHRVKMCQLGVESSDWVAVDPWESEQSEYQTTIATESEDPIKIMLICGADLLESFNKPGVWAPEDIRDILSNYGILVLERSSVNIPKIFEENALLRELQSSIHRIVQNVPNDISSTKLRDSISKGLSIKYLTDDKVIQYIKENKLYLSQ